MTLSPPVLPTLYEYYTGGGIHAGLNADQPYFTLNNRNITIYSGSVHYFRVPRQYWRDRLRKARAAGLNAIETYIPWNLHEPEKEWYDFGQGGSDMQEFLNVAEFLKTAQEEDLFTIVRPGPYMCSEWEFGGFPSWLLRERGIKLRTSDETYMSYVTRYFNILLPILAMLQFTRGGPVIAIQVENEYGSTDDPGRFTPDRRYLRQLKQLMINNGIVELLVSSDSPTLHGSVGTLPGEFLQTANFASDPESEFKKLKFLQPKRPLMAMEFWTGWFDHWSEIHHTRNDFEFYNVYERILSYPASVNMYMFFGGTNFGFMNGANLANSKTDNSGYQPDTTSYDYDAPLTESGDYTLKYVMVKELLKKYNPIATRLPQTPHVSAKTIYQAQVIEQQMIFSRIVNNAPIQLQSKNVMPMEMLPINNNSGQSYGYVIYRKLFIDIPANSVLTIQGRVCDSVVVLINGNLISKPLNIVSDLNGFGFWKQNNSRLNLGPNALTGATIDLLVENWGRNNFGHLEQFNQFKGLWQGGVYLNNFKITNWEVVPLEFKKSWMHDLVGWHVPRIAWSIGPSLYKTKFYVAQPTDTYINMENWCKGIVIINDFVLGRYSRIGPQQSLYLPAPFLKIGWNNVIIFEHYYSYDKIEFSDKPVYRTRTKR